ncbi:MAG: hypothetical protein ACOC1P_00360 [Minisyncoccales bacterium]
MKKKPINTTPYYLFALLVILLIGFCVFEYVEPSHECKKVGYGGTVGGGRCYKYIYDDEGFKSKKISSGVLDTYNSGIVNICGALGAFTLIVGILFIIITPNDKNKN